MENHPERSYWEAAAAKVRRRINSGFFLQAFLPVLVGLSLLQGCLLLLLRRWETGLAIGWIAFSCMLILGAAGAWGWSRKRYFTTDDGLVHLEMKLSLHNRLTAARAGLTAWPSPRPLPQSLRWVWQRILLPPVFAGGFLLLAGWVPVERQATLPHRAPDEPLAWQQVDAWAELLAEREVVDEENLAAWREQVQRLRDQEPEQWYTHSSLEAGDNLRDSAADSIRRLQSALEKAAIPLTIARERMDDMPAGLQPLMQEHWLNALNELSSGALQLNKELLAQLAEVDFSSLQSLSQDQIDRLQQMLREMTEACATCLGAGTCDGEGGAFEGGAACSIHGSGGISKGGSGAPLNFQEFPSLADSQRREAVSNPDLSRAALGDKLGTTQSAPEVDPDTFTGPVSAGGAVQEGDGGEAVWHSRLTPAEQRRLQQYFQ
jgi:hypothetical protein